MSKTRTRLAAAASIGQLALLAAGCGSSGSGSSSSGAGSSASRTGSGNALTGQDTPLGKILTADGGRTLYLFSKDRGPKSMCSGACATNWPPFTAAKEPPVSGGASSADISLVRRSDGKMQVVYNGHPLYFFAGDNSAGQTNGQGLNAFGAPWWTVSPRGSKVVARASSSTGGANSTESSGGGAGGY
jgi:predicted lipoprotein with Yx(FWY)xxD motif